MTFAWIPHESVDEYLDKGWVPEPVIPCHHCFHAVLMRQV